MLVSHTRLILLAKSICQGAGAPATESGRVAELLVEANLQGHDSHGIGMLPLYIRNIRNGLLRPTAHARLLNASGNILLMDGQSGFGQVVGPEAMDAAIDHARQHGVCILGLRNAHHLGRIGGMGEQAAAAGFVSLHYVNVVGHAPPVAAFGGTGGRMSTNPFCCAIPLGDSPPFLLDMATSTIALGKARVAHNTGQPVPDGCLVDHAGRPTNDPAVMFSDPKGAMTYFGGHKGFGLALVCELLAGALVGHWTAQEEHPRGLNVINHMLAIVINPSSLDDSQPFLAEARKFVDYIRSTHPASGGEQVMIPGDPERRNRAERLRGGIPLDDQTWTELLAAAAAVGLDEPTCRRLAGA